jgi:hypothetical protein
VTIGHYDGLAAKRNERDLQTRRETGWVGRGGDCNRHVSNRAAVCARGHRVGKESHRIDSERCGDGCPMSEGFLRKKLFIAPCLAELRIDLFSS